jgi:hypothetical protein
MRLVFAVLSAALVVSGCSSDSESAAPPAAVISLEYSAKEAPDAALAKAEKQCSVYGRHATQRPAAEGGNSNVLIFDCV